MGNNIFVTGANGRLGMAVLEAIPEAKPLVRKEHGLKNEIVTDFSEKELEKILKHAKAVIHLAGSRDFLDKEKCREGNVELTEKIVNATPADGKIIFASSISIYGRVIAVTRTSKLSSSCYGNSDDRKFFKFSTSQQLGYGKKLAALPANEETSVHPDTPYAKTKLEAEWIVAKHPKQVILRIGPIYGPGFEEYFKVLETVEKGKMRILGNGDNHIPFVNVFDVAMVIKNSIERGNGTYVLVGECLTQKEVYAIAAKELGVEPPTEHASLFLAKGAAHFMLLKAKILGGKPKMIPEDVAVLTSNREFDCTKAKKELGFVPRPLVQGIQEMVKEFKKRITKQQNEQKR